LFVFAQKAPPRPLALPQFFVKSFRYGFSPNFMAFLRPCMGKLVPMGVSVRGASKKRKRNRRRKKSGP
jgi:hypothetical protein